MPRYSNLKNTHSTYHIIANTAFSIVTIAVKILHLHIKEIIGIILLVLANYITYIVYDHQPPPWKPEPTVEIESVEVRNVAVPGKTLCEQECDALVVFGYLRNNGASSVFLPRVHVSVVDSAGNIRWTARGFPTFVNLSPGESTYFQVPTYSSASSELVHIDLETQRRS